MNKEDLHKYIELGYSTYKLAAHFNTSQTNIRYWLRKFGLNTNPYLKNVERNRNGNKCVACNKELTGNQIKYCSRTCSVKNHYYKQENTNARQKRVAGERKSKLIEMSGGKCSKCGYNKNTAALSFHHLSTENKVFNLDSRKLSNTRWSSILKEWEKCILLCMNCHIETHNPDKMVGGG